MQEQFLHFIWQHHQFPVGNLTTTDGQPISVIKTGFLNKNAGPDFGNASVKIGKETWVGNVEIHIKSSDWIKHNHQNDKAYDNIILHVVFEHDMPNLNLSCPTLELKKLIPPSVYRKYKSLLKNEHWIPCEPMIKTIDKFVFSSALHSQLINRLERKTSHIVDLQKANNNNWEETCYQLVARSFGLKVNQEPFEQLAKSLPYALLQKHKNNLLQIESLIFGQAGMLNENFKDEYFLALRKEYQFLQKKYQLNPIESHLWKFLRLRPPSFPTIRLAQFSMLIFSQQHLFSSIIETENIKDFFRIFEVNASAYWGNHYRFDVPSKTIKKRFGKVAIQTLIINTIVSLTFVYGRATGQFLLENKALTLLERLPAEKNSIVEHWTNLNFKATNAYDSQAMIELKTHTCDERKCLQCNIGSKILTSATLITN